MDFLRYLNPWLDYDHCCILISFSPVTITRLNIFSNYTIVKNLLLIQKITIAIWPISPRRKKIILDVNFKRGT